jgi:prevent-host-death family protein
MYKEIGAFDAKAQLSALLRDVREGQCYTITVRGEPVANLVPYNGNLAKDRVKAVAAMQQVEKVQGVSPEEVLAWMARGASDYERLLERVEDLEDALLVKERAHGPFIEVELDDL